MAEETIRMSRKEVDRLGVMQEVVGRQLRQKEAARLAGYPRWCRLLFLPLNHTASQPNLEP